MKSYHYWRYCRCFVGVRRGVYTDTDGHRQNQQSYHTIRHAAYSILRCVTPITIYTVYRTSCLSQRGDAREMIKIHVRYASTIQVPVQYYAQSQKCSTHYLAMKSPYTIIYDAGRRANTLSSVTTKPKVSLQIKCNT